MSLSHSEFFHTPALSVECVDSLVVVSDVPVCADNSVVVVLVAEKVGDDIFAVAVSYILSRRVYSS